MSLTSTKLSELCEFAVALLDLPSSKNIILAKNGKRLYQNVNPGDSGSEGGNEGGGAAAAAAGNEGDNPISSVGIANGDLIIVMPNSTSSSTSNTDTNTDTAATRAAASTSTNIATSAAPSSGGLDFSSLLGAATAASNTNTSVTKPPSTSSGGSGGLTFNLPPVQLPQFQQTTPVEFDKMTLDDCMERNQNPSCFIQLLFSPNHPNLMKELNYHSPVLANKLKAAHAKSPLSAANIWREQMQKSAMNSTLSKTLVKQKEHEMENRLRINPMDQEANQYFGNQIRKNNVDQQYRQMINEFPESMGRVLMLYIDAEVNGHRIQAFVDSGAQSTIMSSACAERCGLLHLLDTRFEGVAVGVGTGKILGRVHIAEMTVKGFGHGHIFPCTITIMDSEQGLGDKNMEFLLGLDMLKRHKCNVDLGRNVLQFSVGHEKLETPFLHEHDLIEAKGGTMGFDAEKSNKEIEKLMQDEDDKKVGKAEKSQDAEMQE